MRSARTISTSGPFHHHKGRSVIEEENVEIVVGVVEVEEEVVEVVEEEEAVRGIGGAREVWNSRVSVRTGPIFKAEEEEEENAAPVEEECEEAAAEEGANAFENSLHQSASIK